jgi:hypothetical protein
MGEGEERGVRLFESFLLHLLATFTSSHFFTALKGNYGSHR